MEALGGSARASYSGHPALPFIETFREMLEMRYLWQRTLLLDNEKLVGFLGQEPHTPLDAALRASLAGLGCLTPAHVAAAGHGVLE